MEKYNIYANVSKNRLYLILHGFFTDDEVHKSITRTIAEIKKLRPGFDIINDISDFKPATPVGAEDIKQAQLFAKEHGAKRIIRVLGKDKIASTISAMQFSRTSRIAGYEADMVATVEEAEKLLGD
jgi:hypothetical protein